MRDRLKMMRKRLGFAALASVLALGVAACGGDSDSQQEADGVLAGDVVFWSSYTQGPRAEWLQKMADRFMDENPEVNITIENFSWGEFYTKWTTGLAAGQVPDLSSALPYHVVEMIDVDAIVPVDDVIDNIGRDRFYEKSLLEGQKDGSHYSIPLYSHAQVMWYRKDVLADAGLKVPETWEELRATAEAVTTPGMYGLSFPMGSNDIMAARFLNYYVKSAGETLLTKDGKANLTSKAALDGIEYWVDMYKATSPEGSLNFTVLDQATLFYQGQTAFDFNTGFHIGGVVSTTPDLVDDVEAAPLPRLNKDDPIYGAESGYQPLVVWKDSSVQEESKAFLETLYNDEDYIDFLQAVPVGMMPVLSDIAENPAFLENEIIQQHMASYEVINEAIPLSTAIGMDDGPTLSAGILVNQGVIERMFQDIVLKGTDIQEAAHTAEDQINKMIDTTVR